jgi:hypothetical protein
MSDEAPAENLGQGVDKAVLALCELLALILATPFGEALYNKTAITIRMWIFFFLALGFAIMGPLWAPLRKKFPRQALIESIGAVASNAWVWLLLLLVAFIYLLPPDIFSHIRNLPHPVTTAGITAVTVAVPVALGPSIYKHTLGRPPGVKAPNAAVTASPAIAFPMSDDERQFRFDLRAFVLSDLQRQADAFGQLAALATPNLYENEPQRAAASELFQAALRPEYYSAWGMLSADVNEPIEKIDLTKASKDLRAYFLSYSNATKYFQDYLILSGTDPHKMPPNFAGPNDPLNDLVAADNKAIDSYSHLVTSPVAKTLDITPSGWFWASRTFQSFLAATDASKKR